MKRAEIEQKMKAAHLSSIGLVYKQGDPYGVYCELKGGYLCDYTGHRVNRSLNIWGYVQYINGAPHQVSFEEMNNELLLC